MNETIQNTNESSSKKPPKRPKLEHSLKLPTPPPDPWENVFTTCPKTPQTSKDENAEKLSYSTFLKSPIFSNNAKNDAANYFPFPKTPLSPKDGNSENPFEKDKEKSGRRLSAVNEQDREMLEYVESLHRSLYSRSASTFAPAIVTEEAFDHLEKLYKLMEQMLELREQNVKLHRRIRDLEHLNNLDKISFNPEALEEDYPDLEKDTAFAEAILDSILQDPKNKELQKQKSITIPSILRRRSGSAPDKQVSLEGSDKGEKEKSDIIKKDNHAKVSKWTKVKAAFRWEKASNVGESKSQDSGIHVPVNYEVARYLRVPSTSDEMGHSPGDSGAGVSTPGSLSPASSIDDMQRMGRSPFEDLRSSDDEIVHHYIPHSKDFCQKSQKCHSRTPWGKMKDIIHTRNSLRKKHRLSAASDDIHIDVEFCSDNEDVFEPEDNEKESNPISLSPSPNVYSLSSTSPCGSDIPPEVVERYQKVLAEESTSDSEVKPSKWNRVRKAFLSGEQIVNKALSPKHSISSQGEKSEHAMVEEEIQKNYKKLQKKLSLEFKEKLSEWEKIKQNSPGTSNPPSACGFIEDKNCDPVFMKKMEEWQKIKGQSPTNIRSSRRIQMTREYDLPPDFKKKLQEWEKIKKTSTGPKKRLGEVPKWKSLGPRASDQTPIFEYSALSEDFRKKLDEWKQIKASGGPSAYAEQKKMKDKTPSPKLSRKNSSPKQSKKEKRDPNKELHWFEKELGKIEKEKQRLERERQKFIEREERLSKLRRSVLGTPAKKEILIHTPSGFHRFEGISRKFTQKLYEWEKSQGIAPEASTFALLSESQCTPEVRITDVQTTKKSNNFTPPLIKSKSVDSIAISTLNLTRPILSAQPSSLSLNDMEELEKECMANSKSSSIEYLLEDHGNYLDNHSADNVDLDEPEAVLVEVEDYEEETAEPLHISCAERQQMPVYQREEFRSLCESGTMAMPIIRRSESRRVHYKHDSVKNIKSLLIEIKQGEDEISDTEFRNMQEEQIKRRVKYVNNLQYQSVKQLKKDVIKLQETNISLEYDNLSTSYNETLQHTINEMLELASKLDDLISNRLSENDIFTQEGFKTSHQLYSYISAFRQNLNDLEKLISKKLDDHKEDASDNSRKSSDKDRRYTKLEGHSGPSTLSASQGAVKKRIKYRQKTIQKTVVDTDDEEEADLAAHKSLNKHRKLTRIRSISESGMPPAYDQHFLEYNTKIPAERKISESSLPLTDSAVTVFVKTTRKLFTPLVENSLAKDCDTLFKYDKNTEESSDNIRGHESSTYKSFPEKTSQTLHKSEVVTSLPPLPSSPIPQRKVYKDLSPSIKLIIAKYNQSLEQSGGPKSGGSSGSNSPIAWRSPVSERRVKMQTEKYQEELKKLSPLLNERKGVQKSSSATYLSSSKQVTIPARKASLNITNFSDQDSKNSSIKNNEIHSEKTSAELKTKLTLNIPLANEKLEEKDENNFSPEVRMRKIQKAKEEFMNTPISAPTFITEEGLQYPQRNRLSQISMESESSYDQNTLPGNLIKSASAGMINVDVDFYKKINPEYREEGYVSLPRQTKKSKDGGKSAFSTIASKFRKVKMRRGKDKDREKDKEHPVETLCRQSLFVDITNGGSAGAAYGNINGDANKETCEQRGSTDEGKITVALLPPPVTKSNSWIKRSLFKK